MQNKNLYPNMTSSQNFIVEETMKRNIYLVDDDDDDLFLAQKILSQCAMIGNVICFNNAKDFFAYFENNNDGQGDDIIVDNSLLLLDIHMPNISGIEILDFMRNYPPSENMDIVLLTSDTSPQNIYEAYRLDATGYLKKPFSLEKFHEILEKKYKVQARL